MCFVSVLYDCVEMLYHCANAHVVCNLKVLYVGFYCGDVGVPVSSISVCVLTLRFALMGRALSVFDKYEKVVG